MKKASSVFFIDQQNENAFLMLDRQDPIRKAIVKAVKQLEINAFCGTQIPKKLFPKEFISKYNITNLWKLNLVHGWRLLYTITVDGKAELLTAILEWSDHKNYEKRMKYL